MARPENLWLSPASLAKVDDDNYRAFIIDKAHLPFPENQSGSKRLIADTMMSVGIEVDPVDITYAPAPGDTRSGYVTIVIVAKITDGAQLNAKKVWASHPLARSEPVALPDVGVFTINGVTHSEMSRAPFGGAGYQIGAYVRGVNLVENRLNEERLQFVQHEMVLPMVLSVTDRIREFESQRQATNEASADDATLTDADRKVASAKAASAKAKLEALATIASNPNAYFQTFMQPHNPFNIADAFDKTAGIVPRDDTDRSRAANKVRMRVANAFGRESGLPVVAVRQQGVSGTVKRCLIQIIGSFARTPVTGNVAPLAGTWVKEPVGFAAAPSVYSEKRLTLNIIKTRLHAAACAIARDDVPAEWTHHPYAFDSLSASKSGLAPLAVDVVAHAIDDREQLSTYALALVAAADEMNITVRVTINVNNLVVKQQHREGGSEVYNFEDCVVTASERTGIQIDPDEIENGEAEAEFHDPTPARLKTVVETQALRPQLQQWSNKVSPHLPWNKILEQTSASDKSVSFAPSTERASQGGGQAADGRLVSRQLQLINDRLAKLDERITANEGNSLQVANVLKRIDERSFQTERQLTAMTPAFAQMCQEFAARGPPQMTWGTTTNAATPAIMPDVVATEAIVAAPGVTAQSIEPSHVTQTDDRMVDVGAVGGTEPPPKQAKQDGAFGAPMGAEADDYDSSEEGEVAEQPASKFARIGRSLRSGMATIGAIAGSTTAPLLDALDSVSTFVQQARTAGASEVAAPDVDEATPADDSGTDALMRSIMEKEKELSHAPIDAQRF